MTASIAVSPRPAMVPGGLGYRLWFGNALPFLVAKLFTGRVRVSGAISFPPRARCCSSAGIAPG
jgi:hypothetical protein